MSAQDFAIRIDILPNQKVNYRMNITPEGIVTKVEMEKKSKGKNGSAEWIELKGVESE